MKIKLILSINIIFIGIIISIAGIYKLYGVKHNIDMGVYQFKKQNSIIENNSDEDTSKIYTKPFSGGLDIDNINPHESNANRDNKGISPIALIEFMDDNFKCAVYDTICKETLTFGAGRALSSAYPCKEGNCVLYGHRDSSFKTIEHVIPGNKIKLTTSNDCAIYTVYETFITDPKDPVIFTNSKDCELTLVTCYPFYFIGPAPKRYVVKSCI